MGVAGFLLVLVLASTTVLGMVWLLVRRGWLDAWLLKVNVVMHLSMFTGALVTIAIKQISGLSGAT